MAAGTLKLGMALSPSVAPNLFTVRRAPEAPRGSFRDRDGHPEARPFRGRVRTAFRMARQIRDICPRHVSGPLVRGRMAEGLARVDHSLHGSA